ncbi:MAG: carbamoyltransferase C-terminal domain-containing protein [Bdellovibrionota bacterium]
MTPKETTAVRGQTTEYSVGLGKTIFNSSVAIIPVANFRGAQLALTERFNRIKNSGAWPEKPLNLLSPVFRGKSIEIRENRDVQTTLEFETYVDSRLPLKERLKGQNLSDFSTLHSEIKVVPHHEAHAWAAVLFNPFENALLLILDGAGTKSDSGYEYLSLFRWRDRKLELIERKYLHFSPSKIPGQNFCEGVGIFYEKASEFIFNSKTEAGKVMGLAPFGKSSGVVTDYASFLESLDWKKQYAGKSKAEWQSSENLKYYQDLAATVQESFEFFLTNYLSEIKRKYPAEKNLIFTGGCALNCTFNGKLVSGNLFERVFIPPNPGDESIALGCAASFFFETDSEKWQPTPWETLTSSRGIEASVPTASDIKNVFRDYEVSLPADLPGAVASLLASGEIIAWVQGRSECGPRALGNRSLLAAPAKKGLKDYLNQHIKFREEFRPYGCTVPWELAHEYFDVQPGFENPFMSYAVPVNSKYKKNLESVTHIDGTSRMQTLHQEQNPRFHALLLKMRDFNHDSVLLNTSLNVMNEPIVETAEDARRFLESSQVKILIIGDYIIRKKENHHV